MHTMHIYLCWRRTGDAPESNFLYYCVGTTDIDAYEYESSSTVSDRFWLISRILDNRWKNLIVGGIFIGIKKNLRKKINAFVKVLLEGLIHNVGFKIFPYVL